MMLLLRDEIKLVKCLCNGTNSVSNNDSDFCFKGCLVLQGTLKTLLNPNVSLSGVP